jgi:hypothetical protein
MDDSYVLVDLNFTFIYFGKEYTQVSIGSNGYVCLGENTRCDETKRLSPYDILVGFNYDLDSTRTDSGQIYYHYLSSSSNEFTSSKFYLNLLNPDLEPTQIFMITYDNLLPYSKSTTSKVAFQIFLSIDSLAKKYFVTFNFSSCPSDLSYYASSGLNSKNNAGNFKEVKIADGEQCMSSNVEKRGVWVSEVTDSSKGNRFTVHLEYLINISIF